jgi:hypothetical protein
MISIKQHDTVPDLSITLSDNGSVVNLATANTIKIIATLNGVLLFNRVVTGTSLGVVTMAWQAADTATVGVIQLECEVDWPGVSSVQSFPASGYLRVSIEPDLG